MNVGIAERGDRFFVPMTATLSETLYCCVRLVAETQDSFQMSGTKH
jgi:hypothetical protein